MKHQELLNIQTNADETNADNKKLISREQIPNSPFWMIYYPEEKQLQITMGKYLITPAPIEAEDIITAINKAQYHLENNKWDIMLTVALCAITDILSQRDKNKI